MPLLTQQQLEAVANSIEQVEKHTDAELVTVLASKSDDYLYIPTLWSAVIALLMPILMRFSPYWLDGNELLWLQWATFVVLTLLFRIPFIKLRLVPKRTKHWRASSMARRQFLENNLHQTKDKTGVLIFVSEAEHYVEIIADSGISDKVDNAMWSRIVNEFTGQVKAGNTQSGFIHCIEQCGALLTEHAPYTGDKNELPNHLVIL